MSALKKIPDLPLLASIPEDSLTIVWYNGVMYSVPSLALKGGTFDLLAYGAKVTNKSDAQSDSKSIAKANTAALQVAAQAASDAGSGVVTIPKGDIWFDKGLLDPNVVCQVNAMNRVAFVGGGPGVTRLHIVDGAESNLFNLTGGSSYITIRDLEIDGNRAAQTLGVSGIRGDAFSGIWLENLYIHDIYHYGIGFQGFVQQFIFMNNIKLENLGGDGFDQKNKADADLFQVANNIQIINHGLNLAEVTQAGWDCRGAWQLSNFVIHYTRSDATGIRFRQGNAAEPDVGFGGHRSHLTNFEIYGPGGVTTSTGIECVARDVTVSKGYVRDVLNGVGCYFDTLVSQGAERCTFESVTVESASNAGFLTSAGAQGNTFDNCTANGGTYGFRIRSANCRITNPRYLNNVTAGISVDTGGTNCLISIPQRDPSGTAPVLGLDINAADCSVVGGDVSGSTTNVSLTGARFKATGLIATSATGNGCVVAVGADDAKFVACTFRSNGTNGMQARAARTTIIGCDFLSNGGLGWQSTAAASECWIDGSTFSGNAAAIDDQATNTRFGQGNRGLSAPYTTTLVKQLVGTGSPEGVHAAPVGSTFMRTDGGATTTLYVKTSGTGNTGWTAK